MDLIYKGLSGIAATAATVLFAFLLLKFSKILLKRRLLLALPFIGYLLLGVVIYYKGFRLTGGMVIVLGLIAHIALFVSVIWLRDRIAYNKVNKKSMPSLSAYLNDQERVFFKGKIREQVNHQAIRWFEYYRYQYTKRNTDSFRILSEILYNYRDLNFNPVPFFSAGSCDLQLFNSQIEIVKDANYMNRLFSSLRSQLDELSVELADSKSKKKLKDQIDSINNTIEYYKCAELLSTDVSKILDTDAIVTETNSRMDEAIVSQVNNFIPNCTYELIQRDKFNQLWNSERKEHLVTYVIVMEPIVENTKISVHMWHSKETGLREAASSGNAVLSPVITGIKFHYANIKYNKIIVDIKESAYIDVISIDNYNFNRYKSLVMLNLYKQFVVHLSSAFSEAKSSVSAQASKDDNIDLLDEIVIKHTDALQKQAKAQFGKTVKEIVESDKIKAVALASIDEILSQLDITDELSSYDKQFDVYLATVEAKIRKNAESIIAGAALGLAIDSFDI